MAFLRRPGPCATVALAVVLAALGWVAAPPPAAAATLTAHAPISIIGNAGFNATNGVIAGTGTAADPYVIAGWSIDAPPSMGVQIRSTSAHVIVRDVAVTAAPVDGFYFYAVSNVVLVNITATASAGEGARFESSRDSAILNSTLASNLAGLVLLSSTNMTVRGNQIGGNAGDGVTVTSSPGVTLANNTLSVNGLGGAGYGINLAATTDDVVSGNRFTQNGVFLSGSSLAEFDSHTITPDNLVAGAPILYEKDCSGLHLDGLEVGELLVANCAGLHVSNSTFAWADVGIEVAVSAGVTVGPGILVTDASLGVVAVQSSRLTIWNSSALDTGTGILLQSVQGARVAGTKLSSPFPLAGQFDGIVVSSSDAVNLTGNLIRHHRTGVSIVSSSNVSVVGNVLELDGTGVSASASGDLLVLGNQAPRDFTALRFAGVTNATVVSNAFLGSVTEGANLTDSSGILLYHNDFSASRDNAYDGNGTADAWDDGYPAGGNYWGNYFGPDLCSGPLQDNCTGGDGIGDTPYVFDVNASDRYPLIAPPVAAHVPPDALFALYPGVGTVLTSFTVSANLSTDYVDPLSALQVRWSWDANASWTAWTANKDAVHQDGVAGTHTIPLEVAHTAGLTDTWSWSVTVVPKPDALPPAIDVVPPASATVGQPIRILANITDPSGVRNATLLYRGVDGGPFRSLPMQIENQGVNFTATIPAQPHAGTVVYAIVANDTWANEARAPLSGTSKIPVVDPLMSLLQTVVPGAAGAVVIAVGLVLWARWRRSKERRAGRRPPPGEPPVPPPDGA